MIGMRSAPLQAALLCLLAGCASSGQSTGPSGEVSADQNILNVLDEQRTRANGSGLVIVGVEGSAKAPCTKPQITVGRVVEGGYKIGTFDTYQPTIFGPIELKPLTLPAGEYVVGAVTCDKRRYNGPHARFQVRAGEIVDIGTLQVEFSSADLGDVLLGRGSLKRSVGTTSPKRLQAMREKTPLLMNRVVSRPMTIIGEGEIKMGRRGLF